MPGSEMPDARPLFPRDTQIIKALNPDDYMALRGRAHAAIDLMLEHERWDVVHDHMGAYLTAQPKSSIPAGTGTVLSVYGLRSNPHYAEIYRRAGALQADRRMVVTACSLYHRRHLLPTVATDYVVRHAVPDRALLDASPDPMMTIYWAAIMPGKAQLEVARVARGTGAKVVFAGPVLVASPSDARYAERFLEAVSRADPAPTINAIDERSLTQPTTYVGEVFDMSVQEALFARAGRFLLCAKHEEPFSLAILEAMAYGLPVAAGPFDSAVEALDGVGHFVESLDPRDIAAGLRWLGPRREDVQAHARREFSIPEWAARWDAVYADSINRSRN